MKGRSYVSKPWMPTGLHFSKFRSISISSLVAPSLENTPIMH